MKELCQVCLQMWERLAPPGGNAHFGVVRPRLDLTFLKCSLEKELRLCNAGECYERSTEQTEEANYLAELRLFGAFYSSIKSDDNYKELMDMRNDKEGIPLSTLFKMFPTVVGPLKCHNPYHGESSACDVADTGATSGAVNTELRSIAVDLLRLGASAVSFSLYDNEDYRNHEAAKDPCTGLQNIFVTALNNWKKLTRSLGPHRPRRIEVEIDLTSVQEYATQDWGLTSKVFSELALELRGKAEALSLRLPIEFILDASVTLLVGLSSPVLLIAEIPEYARYPDDMLEMQNMVMQKQYPPIPLRPRSPPDAHQDHCCHIVDDVWRCFEQRCVKPDDGMVLCPVVIADSTGIALSLTYVSHEDLREQIRSRRGGPCYIESPRWFEGNRAIRRIESCKHRLRRIDLDYSRGCLRFCVDRLTRDLPPGILFPRVGSWTDWGPNWGVRKLLATLEARGSDPDSVARRLLNNPKLLREKLIESARELDEADDNEKTALKASGLICLLLLRCAGNGVGIEDIERHLDATSLLSQPANTRPSPLQVAPPFCLNPLNYFCVRDCRSTD